ncbi:hypothetical protein QBC39DRAFT_435410 [Podospora conica]|nr:hypothetical protein QBC39DRAFT_435410 [Schizothecium conicum]
MAITRSGKRTGDYDLPPAKKRSPGARTSSPGPLGRLPLEIFWQVARSFPDDNEPGSKRPSQLYPLATTCKGFWQALRPMLFEFDVDFEMLRVKLPPSIGRYWNRGGKDPKSALVWALKKNHTSMAKFAIETAQSMGKLQEYTSVSYEFHDLVPNICTLWHSSSLSADDRLDYQYTDMDPLSLAIIKGNTSIVELLLKDAHYWTLSTEWAAGSLFRKRDDVLMPMTPLNVAIWMREYGIAKILLQKFSELDLSTLRWNEPTGLGFAAFLGDVKMARLMLDGEDGLGPATSPWVPRIRAQLLDDQAYDQAPSRLFWDNDRRGTYDLSTCPPMIIAGVGSGRPCWRAGGEEIFSFLASKGPHLVTKARRGWRGTNAARTPLEAAFVSAASDNSKPFREDGPLALIRLGALKPCPLVSPTPEHRRRHLAIGAVLRASRTSIHDPYKVIETWWDSALECHGGTADAGFLKCWEHGMNKALPTTPINKLDRGFNHMQEALVKKWTTSLDTISLLDRKSPGFAQLRAIRKWLDDCVFHGIDDFFGHEDFGGHWSHLRPSPWQGRLRAPQPRKP